MDPSGEDTTLYLADEMLNRKATEPLDMAFGLRSVIGRLREREMLPAPDYSLLEEQVYKSLTLDLPSLAGFPTILVASYTSKCQTNSFFPQLEHQGNYVVNIRQILLTCEETQISQAW